jgi:hypothetical protein
LPIAAGEIQFRLTHADSITNTDPKLSLGGIRTNTQVASDTSQNLFDNVSGTESRDGDVEYRCIFVFNANNTITLEGARIWFNGTTASTDDEVDMALGDVAVGAGTTEQVIASENTTPNNPELTFSHPLIGSPLTIGDIPPLNQKGVWFRRTVNAGAAAYANNNFSWTVEGESQ